MNQQRLRAAFYRGGTSKAVIFRKEDLLDIVTQMMSRGLPHKATPLTGAVCLAAACKTTGTVANAVANPAGLGREEFRIGHPSGVLQLTAACERVEGAWRVAEAGIFRTARRLFEGHVLVPTA